MTPSFLLIASAVTGLLAATDPPDPYDLRDAVRSSDVQRVQSLLSTGADVNAQCENRHTPIYDADDLGVVELLLAHGAKLDIRSAASGQSPLESAAEKYFRDVERRDTWEAIVATLRAAGAEYTIDTAIYMNDIGFVEEELANDASWVNKRRGASSVPLRIAARTGRVEICRTLLEHGADPDDFEQGGGYPIMYDAVEHDAVVKLLIANGANLRRRITWMGGRTGIQLVGDEASALHYAVARANLESVKLLIAAGLDPNAADLHGQTPLHIAITFEWWDRTSERDSSKHVKIIEYLLDNEASLRFTDRNGRTASHLAVTLESPEDVRRVLRQAEQRRNGWNLW